MSQTKRNLRNQKPHIVGCGAFCLCGRLARNTTTPPTEVKGAAMYESITPEDLLRQLISRLTMQEYSLSDHPSNGEAVRSGHETFTFRNRWHYFLYSSEFVWC
jgi:hypothetical protein